MHRGCPTIRVHIAAIASATTTAVCVRPPWGCSSSTPDSPVLQSPAVATEDVYTIRPPSIPSKQGYGQAMQCRSCHTSRFPPVVTSVGGRGDIQVCATTSQAGAGRVHVSARTRYAERRSPLTSASVVDRLPAGRVSPGDPAVDHPHRGAYPAQLSSEPATGLALANLTRTFGARTVVNGLTMTA